MADAASGERESNTEKNAGAHGCGAACLLLVDELEVDGLEGRIQEGFVFGGGGEGLGLFDELERLVETAGGGVKAGQAVKVFGGSFEKRFGGYKDVDRFGVAFTAMEGFGDAKGAAGIGWIDFLETASKSFEFLPISALLSDDALDVKALNAVLDVRLQRVEFSFGVVEGAALNPMFNCLERGGHGIVVSIVMVITRAIGQKKNSRQKILVKRHSLTADESDHADLEERIKIRRRVGHPSG